MTKTRTLDRNRVDATAPSTLAIGLYQGDEGCSIYATFRQADGTLQEDVASEVGVSGWELFDVTLATLRVLKARQCVLYTNHVEVLAGLLHPDTPPKSDKVMKVKGWREPAEYGGNIFHWHVISGLTEYMRYSGYDVVEIDGAKLGKARRIYDDEVSQGDASRYRTGTALPAVDDSAAQWFEQAALLEF